MKTTMLNQNILQRMVINMPNSLEEELRAVQHTKAMWSRRYNEVDDPFERKQILSKIYYLSDEESRILSELGR